MNDLLKLKTLRPKQFIKINIVQINKTKDSFEG